uniref:EB domain-containing protein n=1 Tax=Setaria digitata TaxID=48799 RepID=A0A915Q2N0_9BILA
MLTLVTALSVCWSSSPLSTTTKVPTDPNSVSITRPSYAGYLNPLLTAYPWYTGIRPEFGGIGYERRMQPCSLTEQCIYGQICVDGFCLPSNVAQIGKQSQPLLISCSTGAPCPVGYYCMNGFCVRNALTSTFACSRGICPTGMTCFIGRCVSSSYIGK